LAENDRNGESEDRPTPADISALIIGQATAVLAVAAAVIYAAGGLSLGLRLWYDQYQWEPVLGQLPRDFVLVDALVVMIPAIIIGFFTYLLYERLPDKIRQAHGCIVPWLLSAALASVLAVVPLVFLHFVRKNTIHGVIRPYWEIYVFCWILNVIIVGMALYMLPKTVNLKSLQAILTIGVLAFAFIPAIASVSAAFRFPIVELCGPSFRKTGDFGPYAIGNLIGTNGQWVYVAETVADPPTKKRKSYLFRYGYIAVIPLSAVQLESIGSHPTCGDLREAVTPRTKSSPAKGHKS
jgi:hypothetical protein